MAVQRFLPDVDRTQRTAGVIFLSVGGLIAVLVAWGAFVFGRVTVTTIVFIVIPAALAALGARLAFRRHVVIEVDLEQRRYAVIRKGKPAASGALDDLGPLVVSQRTRVSGTGNNRRTVVEYVVNPSAHSKIDLYVLLTPGQARRKAEALARAWHLPCRSLGGAVRSAKDLDVPLYERLRNDRQAAAATALRPEWGVRIEPASRGHAIVSTHRSWGPLAQGAFTALGPIALFGGAAYGGLLSTLREAGGNMMDRIFLGLVGVVILAVLWKLWQGARDTFFPGAIQVTE